MGGNTKRWWAATLALCAAIAILAAFFASSDPDGLDATAERLGFGERAAEAPVAVLPGYTIPGIEGPLGTAVAGLVGLGIVLGLILLLGRRLERRGLERR